MSKSNAQFTAALGIRRAPEDIARDMKSTVLGAMAQESDAPIIVPITKVLPSPFQVRTPFRNEDIEKLATSITDAGLISPIVVRRVGDDFELIAGHKRTAACKKIGREFIPAIVRELSDHEAARALTSDNTLHNALTDWDLYKHADMLLSGGHVKNKRALEEIFGVSHGAIFNLLAFGDLPPEVKQLLDTNPSLIGGSAAFAVRDFSKSHPSIVVDAFKLIADGKLKQTLIKQWIVGKITPATRPIPNPRHEFSIGDSDEILRLVVSGTDVKMSGVRLDPERLADLIRERLEFLKVSNV